MSPVTPIPAFELASKWLLSFEKACYDVSRTDGSDETLDAFMDLFLPNSFWRDSLCLSWDLRTHEGAANIRQFLKEDHRLAKAGFHEFAIDTSSSLGGPIHKSLPYEKGIIHDVVEFSFYFQLNSPPGRSRSLVRLVKAPNTEEWKAYLLYTVLQSIAGHEPTDTPPYGHYEGHTNPTAVVIGGGTGGLMMASRLRDVGIKVLVLERNEKVGDTWRNRYDLLTLNVGSIKPSMPKHPFPKNMPLFIPKTKFADFLQFWALDQEIPIWTSTELLPNPTYDDGAGIWTLKVIRDGAEITLNPKHLIMATGLASTPDMPVTPGAETFKGTILHSHSFKDANSWVGKNVVVVGAGVSGMDIALEAEARGANVTIIQRSPMCVLRQTTLKENITNIWPVNRPVEDSDFFMHGNPLNLTMRLGCDVITPRLQLKEKDLHDALREKGFLIGWGEHLGRGPVGQIGLLYAYAGGFVSDVGCCQRIIDGRVKLRSSVSVAGVDEEQVILTDGSKLDADVLVYATGLKNPRTLMEKLLGDDNMRRTGELKIWDFDREGEFNGVYRSTGHPGLWFAMGIHNEMRYLSKLLALQILGRELGLVNAPGALKDQGNA
ncbi:FAD/NAD(P)-binding domain-containing protein [Mycena metata]|uniref:FAD/NAD(P)-binding domain-containing protein n=1 Tax=Mycena metata TaxID=1033252 RepID=A0AAD7JUQ5_9AGAR|nr:FAD/NAD(P)-binding domain-containing protein [Mycena metata]